MRLEFPGVAVTVTEEALVVRSEKPLLVLSSAVAGGGMARVRYIINRHVERGYVCQDPEAELAAFAKACCITEPFVGLMTAVPMEKARAVSLSRDGLTVAVLATAGLGNLAAPGLSPPASAQPGTINLVVLVDAALSSAAMVNAIITATEAKAHVLMERGARTAEGYRATGTSTDAVVLACTSNGAVHQYAGPATLMGWLVGRGVCSVLEEALGPAPQ
jgi:iron complex transport system ATP-binding protein